jgi:hypothetical protein
MVRYPDANRRPANHGAKNMRKMVLSLAVLSAILLPALCTAPAHASIQTFVSHSGSDTTACETPAHACQTLAYALSQTASGGQITCLDAGAYGGGMTITIAVIINCSETTPVGLSSFNMIACTSAVTINAPGSVVILRGLDLNGYFDSPCTTNGILIQAAIAVSIEDCVIEFFPQKGILDQRASGQTSLAIKNTIVRYNQTAGIVLAAAPKNSVVLDNVQSVGNTFGLAVATGNNVVIANSVLSENTIAGIEVDSGGQVFVDTTKITHNFNYGIYAVGGVTLANSDIAFNTSSISGATMSYGNNRLYGNGGGTAPTLISQQ